MIKREELIRKCLLLGVGITAYAQEKAERLISEFVQKNHITTAEGKMLVRKVMREAERSGKKVARMTERKLRKLLHENTQRKKKAIPKPKRRKLFARFRRKGKTEKVSAVKPAVKSAVKKKVKRKVVRRKAAKQRAAKRKVVHKRKR